MKVDLTKSIRGRAASEAKDFARNDLAGADEWRQSKVGWLTGVSTLGKAAGTVGNVARDVRRNVVGLAGAVFRTETAEMLPTQSSDTAERFRVAQKVYRKTDTDIVSFQAATHSGFVFYAFLLICCLSLGIASFGMYETGMPLAIDVTARFIPVPALLVLTMRWSFYNWQFRTRRLGSVGEWLRSPGEWWPEPPAGGQGGPGGGTLAALCVVAVGAALSLSGQAHADTSIADAFANPKDSDLWKYLLELVFPQIGSLGGTPNASHNAIAGAFGAFLAVMMAIASGMMSWHVLAGMVNTAHEGKVLGQRWHQTWSIMRVSVGVGMLAPVVKGYCTAQLLAIQIALWGGSLGNVVWYGYVDSLNVAKIERPELRETIEFTRDVAVLEVCHATLTEFQRRSGGSIVPAYPAEPTSGNWAVVAWDETVNIYTKISNEMNSLFSWSSESANLKADAAKEHGVRRTMVWDYGPCGKIQGGFMRPGENPSNFDGLLTYDTARIEAIEGLRARAKVIAEMIAKGMAPGGDAPIDMATARQVLAEYLAAKAEMDRKILAGAQVYVDAKSKASLAEFQTAAKEAGWIAAGPYYMALTRMQNHVMSMLKDMPEVSVSTGARIDGGEATKRLFDETVGAIPMFRQLWDTSLRRTPTLSSHAAKAGQVEPDALGFESLLDFFFDWGVLMKAVHVFEVKPGVGTAMQQMVNFGHKILDAAYGILALVVIAQLAGKANLAAAVASKVASMAAGKLGLGGVGTPLMMMIMLMAMGIIGVGVVHAYIIPIIPSIQFFFFTMGMLILTVEAVIAAPLWAFFHIRMDGQEFVDQVQRPGYMILFNLLLRIPLALFGLFFSILVFEAMVWLLSVTFYPAVVSATSANWSGLIGTLVMVVMLSYLHYQTAIRSFNLITQVPDRVSRWFGQSGEQLGETEDSQKTAGFLVSNIEHRVGKMAETGIGGAMARRSASGGKSEQVTKMPETPEAAGPGMPGRTDRG